MKNAVFSTPKIVRRFRQSMREVAATMLLTLAAAGFLVAAIYGGGMPELNSNVRDVQTTTTSPGSVWNDSNAFSPTNGVTSITYDDTKSLNR